MKKIDVAILIVAVLLTFRWRYAWHDKKDSGAKILAILCSIIAGGEISLFLISRANPMLLNWFLVVMTWFLGAGCTWIFSNAAAEIIVTIKKAYRLIKDVDEDE